MNSNIWRNVASWPKDAPGYVFLGRAIEYLGTVLFKERWRKDAPYLVITENLLAKNFYKNDEGRLANRLLVDVLAEKYPDQAPTLRASLRTFARPISFTTEQRREAFELVEARRESEIQARKAFIEATKLITEWAVAGRLATAARDILGGELFDIPSHNWNSERLADRFEQLRLIPARPFDHSGEASDDEARWIFVSREHLYSLAKHQTILPDGQPNSYRSLYLDFMIKMTDELGLRGDNQGKKASIVESIKEEWQRLYGEELSDRLSKAMATLIRDPESQLGKNAPRLRD